MASKFIISVVLATVSLIVSLFGVQGSLSSSQLRDDYSTIGNLYQSALSPYFEGINALFDGIYRHLAELAAGRQHGTNGAVDLTILSTNMEKTLAGFRKVLSITFDAIAIINPEAAVANAAARVVGDAQVPVLVIVLYTGLDLAKGSIVPTGEQTIEVLETGAADAIIPFVENNYLPLQTVRSSNAKSNAAIQIVLEKSICRLQAAIHKIFTAFKILRDAVADGSPAAAEAALSKIKLIEEEVLSTIQNEYLIKFNLYKSCLLSDSLLEAVDSIDSTAIADTEDEAISEYEELVDVVKIRIKNYLEKVESGNRNGTAGYFCTSQSITEPLLSVESTKETSSNVDEILTETLLLTDPPTFNVTNLQINETTTQLAIWGDRGIAVVELPKRWGKEAAFQGGKEIISCRSHSLDERLFHCFGVTEVRRARWHPGSTKDSHLLVLTSENTFHLYECELNGSQSLVRTWSVGPASGSPSKIPTSASLGDTAVDFDFVTPTLKPEIDIKDIEVNKIDWKDIEWPILVLKGNGDVCAVHNNVLTAKAEKPVVTGPLSIYPRADDNYGVDSCSIMCLQTTPPLVVIATSNGKVYHSILLREGFEDDEKKTWSQYGSTFSLHTPEDALFVYECVEMELGLCIREDEKKYSCPVHLHVDRGNSSRYFCSHNAGIHVVNLPMVSQLQEYIQGKDEDADLLLPTLSNQSSSQYLVCTRTKSTQEPAPILGFGLLQDPCILIALLHTGMAISLSVVDLHYLLKIKPLDPVTSPSKKIAKEPFDVHIKNILKHDVSQPILKLGPNAESSPQEVLELLLRATHVFRTEHFARQDKVQAEIAKRIRTLRALKTHQLKELESLAEVKKKLQEAAEHLAERYEDIKDKQEELARRAEEVLRLINQRQPSMSAIEKEEANELKKMNNKMKELSQQLEKLKNKSKYQSEQLTNWDKNEAKKDVIIRKSQEDTIKAHLTQMSVEIADLVSTVKSLQEELSA